MKKIIQQYKQFSGSTRFWNNSIIAFAIILPFINLEVAMFCASCASLLAVGLIMDGKCDESYWWLITPTAWILFFVGVICQIHEKLVKPFNTWLDKKLK